MLCHSERPTGFLPKYSSPSFGERQYKLNILDLTSEFLRVGRKGCHWKFPLYCWFQQTCWLWIAYWANCSLGTAWWQGDMHITPSKSRHFGDSIKCEWSSSLSFSSLNIQGAVASTHWSRSEERVKFSRNNTPPPKVMESWLFFSSVLTSLAKKYLS